MEVRINKEVRNYQESLFFGLSLRQFLFALLAVAVAVAAFGLLTVHTLWARRALFHEVRRQQARERRIAAAREHDKEAADASAS